MRSLVGSVEVMAGLFAGHGFCVSDFSHFLLWATQGNSIGGAIFVALVKYSHVVRSDRSVRQVRLRNLSN